MADAPDIVDSRERMVETVRRHGVRDEQVLAALRAVPRHRFIPEPYRSSVDAYGDYPCPIGRDQTISQPYIVAYMTARLALAPGDRVLEVGTGCGYQAAVLAAMGARVYGIERIAALADLARRNLASMPDLAVDVVCADGTAGLPAEAPFAGILVACATREVPPALPAQLADGGRLILPLEDARGAQRLVLITRHGDRLERQDDLPVRFVPLLHGLER